MLFTWIASTWRLLKVLLNVLALAKVSFLSQPLKTLCIQCFGRFLSNSQCSVLSKSSKFFFETLNGFCLHTELVIQLKYHELLRDNLMNLYRSNYFDSRVKEHNLIVTNIKSTNARCASQWILVFPRRWETQGLPMFRRARLESWAI